MPENAFIDIESGYGETRKAVVSHGQEQLTDLFSHLSTFAIEDKPYAPVPKSQAVEYVGEFTLFPFMKGRLGGFHYWE